jgi:hypothetical protein
MSALRSLADLKSQRAHPVLERIANKPTTRGRGDEAQRRRDHVRIAEKGLQKLDRAVAAGKAQPEPRTVGAGQSYKRLPRAAAIPGPVVSGNCPTTTVSRFGSKWEAGASLWARDRTPPP